MHLGFTVGTPGKLLGEAAHQRNVFGGQPILQGHQGHKTEVAHLKTEVTHLKTEVAHLKTEVTQQRNGGEARLQGSHLSETEVTHQRYLGEPTHQRLKGEAAQGGSVRTSSEKNQMQRPRAESVSPSLFQVPSFHAPTPPFPPTNTPLSTHQHRPPHWMLRCI